MNTYEGHLVATGLKFGVVVARFNELLSSRLLSGAQDALVRHGASEGDIDVDGSRSVRDPLVTGKLATSGATTRSSPSA